MFIQNFRPGVAEELNVGCERLQTINPALIYCGISGFGHDGPDCERPAYDTVAQAASGWLRLLINPKNPRVVGPAIADAVTGYYAAFGILGALHERESTGKGRRIDVSMLEAMCHFNLDDFTHYFSQNEIMGPFSRPSVSQSYVFECADGKWIAMHMSSPEKFWQGLARAIERPDAVRRSAICRSSGAHQASGRPHHPDDADLQDETPRRMVRAARLAKVCRSRRSMIRAKLFRTARRATSAIQVEGRHPTMGRFRTVRFPVNFDGAHETTVVPPPTLGEHDGTIRARADDMWRRRATDAAE